MKIGLIGAGNVGQAALLSIVMKGSAREIVVLDKDPEKAKAAVADLHYGTPLTPAVDLCVGDYADLAGAALVIITAGENEKEGGATDRSDPQGRLKLLRSNVWVYRDILPQLHRAVPNAVVLVVTDPPDPLADLARAYGFHRVLSSGTFLDSLRFRFYLAQELGVNPASVQADVVGEHGTSEVFLWSSAWVGGVPVYAMLPGKTDRDAFHRRIEHQVRYANITVIEGNQASQFGIAVVLARLVEIVLRDERVVLPIGSFNLQYGVTLSMPSILGREGVLRILAPEMSEEEQQGLEQSAEKLRKAVQSMNEKQAG